MSGDCFLASISLLLLFLVKLHYDIYRSALSFAMRYCSNHIREFPQSRHSCSKTPENQTAQVCSESRDSNVSQIKQAKRIWTSAQNNTIQAQSKPRRSLCLLVSGLMFTISWSTARKLNGQSHTKSKRSTAQQCAKSKRSTAQQCAAKQTGQAHSKLTRSNVRHNKQVKRTVT